MAVKVMFKKNFFSQTTGDCTANLAILLVHITMMPSLLCCHSIVKYTYRYVCAICTHTYVPGGGGLLEG